jgi:ribosome biogenesis protein Nip4
MNKKLIERQLGSKLYENIREKLDKKFDRSLLQEFKNTLCGRICMVCMEIEWKLRDEIERKLNEQETN